MRSPQAGPLRVVVDAERPCLEMLDPRGSCFAPGSGEEEGSAGEAVIGESGVTTGLMLKAYG